MIHDASACVYEVVLHKKQKATLHLTLLWSEGVYRVQKKGHLAKIVYAILRPFYIIGD